MNSKVQALINDGASGNVIDVECHLSNNLPNIVIVGFANKAVDEAKERLGELSRTAMCSCLVNVSLATMKQINKCA